MLSLLKEILCFKNLEVVEDKAAFSVEEVLMEEVEEEVHGEMIFYLKNNFFIKF